MKTKPILAALATASLIVGGQALAQGRGGGGGHGHGGTGVGAGVGSHGGIGTGGARVGTGVDVRGNAHTGTGRDFGIRTRTDARARSQGPAHANDRARARANENSVLATGRTSTDLSLLRSGLTVRDSSGLTLGTIARVNRTEDGRIVNVLVRDRDGRRRTIPVAPNTLSINGDVVTTTLIGLR